MINKITRQLTILRSCRVSLLDYQGPSYHRSAGLLIYTRKGVHRFMNGRDLFLKKARNFIRVLLSTLCAWQVMLLLICLSVGVFFIKLIRMVGNVSWICKSIYEWTEPVNAD